MSGELVLSCRTDDPIDAVSRILMLLARCSIAIGSLEVSRDAGAWFAADFRLVQPLPIAADNLVDRVRQIPSITAAQCHASCSENRLASVAGDRHPLHRTA